MTLYMLDTNIVSHMVRNPAGAVFTRLDGIDRNRVAISVIVACELRFGIEKSPSPKLIAGTKRILASLEILPLPVEAGDHYGRLRADLARRGTVIGGNDMFIAAHALALGATLVTANVREFERVAGLAIENWLLSD